VGPETTERRTVVRLEGAISVVNQFPALSGLDLEVGEGEIVLLQGPNGAGKSTLLRLCAGLAPLSGGTGIVLDRDLSDRDQRRRLRRETGLLAHETFLYDELTVEENVGFWAEANRVDPAAVDPILDRLELGKRLRSVRVSDLSAGQRRRTSLAIMICRRPRLWLLDEPHGGLDQAGRDLVDDLIGHAVRFGATVVLASHDLERASSVADRTLTVVGGRVIDERRGGRPTPAGDGDGRDREDRDAS
jgi:heme ABC exporter ATP-binding subunit CcmA